MRKISFIFVLFLFGLVSFNAFAIDLGDIIKTDDKGRVQIGGDGAKSLTKEVGDLKNVTKEIGSITKDIKTVRDSIKNIDKEISGVIGKVTSEVDKVTGEINNVTTQLKEAQKHIETVTGMLEYVQEMLGKVQDMSKNIDTYLMMVKMVIGAFLVLLLLPSILCVKMYFDIRKIAKRVK